MGKNKTSRKTEQPNRAGPTQGPRTPFQTLCRLLFALLKILHHHEVMINSKTVGLPRAFQQKVAELSKFLKPAHPNSNLTQELSSLAETWGLSVRDRLAKHYEEEISSIESAIRDLQADISDQFDTAVQVSLNWAKNRMGKKLTNSTKSNFQTLAQELRKSLHPRTRHRSGPPQLETPAGPSDREVGKSKREARSPDSPSGIQPCKRAPARLTPPIQVLQPPPCTQTGPRQVAPPANTTKPARDPARDTPLKRSRSALTPSSASSQSPTPAPKIPRQDPGAGASPDFSWIAIQENTRKQREVRVTGLHTEKGGCGKSPLGTPEANAGPHHSKPDFSASPADLDSFADFPPIPKPQRPSPRPLKLDGSPRKSPQESRAAMVKTVNKLFREGSLGPIPAEVVKHPKQDAHAKFTDWHIQKPKPGTKTLILGDSNLSRITNRPSKLTEIQSYPGARTEHMVAMLNKTQKQPLDSKINNVVLAFGTNDANSKTPMGSIERDIKRMSTLAKSKFPRAQISLAEVVVSATSPLHLVQKAEQINEIIRKIKTTQIIPRPHSARVVLEAGDRSKVHWTRESANMILKHWHQCLN